MILDDIIMLDDFRADFWRIADHWERNPEFHQLKPGESRADCIYPALIDQYITKGRFEPLVKYFSRWNWEIGLDNYIRTIAAGAVESSDAEALIKLFGSPIRKQRNALKKAISAHRRDPEAVPLQSVERAGQILIATMNEYEILLRQVQRDDEADVCRAEALALRNKWGL